MGALLRGPPKVPQKLLVLRRAMLLQQPYVEAKIKLLLVVRPICPGTIAGLKTMGNILLYSRLIARFLVSGNAVVLISRIVRSKNLGANFGMNPLSLQRRRTLPENYICPRHILTVPKLGAPPLFPQLAQIVLSTW